MRPEPVALCLRCDGSGLLAVAGGKADPRICPDCAGEGRVAAPDVIPRGAAPTWLRIAGYAPPVMARIREHSVGESAKRRVS